MSWTAANDHEAHRTPAGEEIDGVDGPHQRVELEVEGEARDRDDEELAIGDPVELRNADPSMPGWSSITSIGGSSTQTSPRWTFRAASPRSAVPMMSGTEAGNARHHHHAEHGAHHGHTLNQPGAVVGVEARWPLVGVNEVEAFPTAIAASWRIRDGAGPIPECAAPAGSASHAARCSRLRPRHAINDHVMARLGHAGCQVDGIDLAASDREAVGINENTQVK